MKDERPSIIGSMEQLEEQQEQEQSVGIARVSGRKTEFEMSCSASDG